MGKKKRKHLRKVTAREFFIHKFKRDPNHPVERAYFTEWKHRFATGYPERYMDSKSLKIYRMLQRKKLKLPKGYKGRGGICVRAIKR